jgi:long-chain acyl-CoA synthetase
VSTTTASILPDPPRTLDDETLCAAFQRTAAEHPDDTALRSADGSVTISWREYGERVRRIAEGLHSLGLRRGDALALLLTNRPEFHLLDAAALHMGAVPFSVYTTSAPEQIEYLLRDSGARVAVTERSLRGHLGPGLEQVVLVDGADGALSLDELERRRAPRFDFDAAWRAVGGDDLLTLIYTSGTTGPPKGVELTHRNLFAAWRGMHAAWRKPSAGGSTISYLPHAHIADRFASHYAGMLFGTAVSCCPDPRQVAKLLPEVRPTHFVGVPRVWQKMKLGIEAALPANADAPPDDAVRAAVRRRIGLDRCESAVSAAAPIPSEVLEFFQALGVPIVEVYGLSETCAAATANPLDRPRIGTVGPPIPGVELRLADDGEVLLRGEMLMRGYRNRPDKTVEAVDADGWLHTGDVGVLDADGYLRIVDRKKELIINAAGKNMSPANIETTLKAASPLIGHACVIGDARPHNVALLTLEPEAAQAFTASHSEEELRAAVAAAVERANSRLSRVEQIKRYRLLEHDWLPGGVELTPTMKLKRRGIARRYAEEIEALYTHRPAQ